MNERTRGEREERERGGKDKEKKGKKEEIDKPLRNINIGWDTSSNWVMTSILFIIFAKVFSIIKNLESTFLK